jgi:hypothetical protein
VNIPQNLVTLGGVVVGLSILAWNLTRWWTGSKKRSIRDLMPFIACALYGMLLILTAGGLLGGLADVALWGSSAIGDAALEYGVGAGTPNVTRSSSLVLTDGGSAAVIVSTVILIAVWTRKRGFRWDFALNITCGISLGLSSGVAGWAAMVLGPVVNTAGDAIVGLL